MLAHYPALIRINFTNQLAFRLKTAIGVFNLFLVVVVNIAIWKALYGGASAMGGMSFSRTVTNLILGIGISSVFAMDEFAVARRIRSGDIAVDLLRPGSFWLSNLASSLGQTLYRVLIEFLPLLLVSALVFGLEAPASPVALGLFFVSLLLGYMVFYLMSWIFSLIAFWYFNIWSFVTFRNTLVAIMGGIYLPYWFMPDWLRALVPWTPFDALWSIPVQCWLGVAEPAQLAWLALRQVMWIGLLGGLAWLLWRRGCRKLVVQGG